MDSKKRSDTGTDLVKRVKSDLPAQVTINDDEMARLRQEFHEIVQENKKTLKSCAGFSAAAVYGGSTIAAGTFAAFMSFPVGSVSFAIALLGSLVVSSGVGACAGGLGGSFCAPKEQRDEANENFQLIYKDLQSSFRQSQKQAFVQRQALLVQMADQVLEEGGLLNEDVMAALAVLPVKRLKQASDDLAISVLQARGALAYHRCSERQADGEKAIQKPLTFEQMQFNPALALHAQILRERLEQVAGKDWKLPEEKLPEFEKLDMAPPKLKVGFWGRLGRAVALPLYLPKDIKELCDHELPAAPAVAVKPLAIAEDFKAALAGYEKNVEKLDLPAMRGGVKSAAPLPKPLQRLPS